MQKFDIDFVTSHFGSCNLRHYIDIIKSANSTDLRELRAQIISHSRIQRQQQAFSNTPGLSSHEALVKAINHTLLLRSPVRHMLWSSAMPVRQWLVRTFSGLNLKKDDSFGAIYTQPDHRKTVFHMPHSAIGNSLVDFYLRNWQFLVKVTVAIAAILVTWLVAT
jgi:hypothetical protein